MKIKVYQEYQGQGGVHVDENGFAWCAFNPETKAGVYLKAKDKETAVKEAAKKFGVEEYDVEG